MQFVARALVKRPRLGQDGTYWDIFHLEIISDLPLRLTLTCCWVAVVIPQKE